MLLEFKCSNHKSIKGQVSFSMLAGTDDTHEEYLMKFGKFRVSHAAVIYGANGSGKSNFIDALRFMRELVTNRLDYKLNQPVPQFPHKLSKKGTPSEYDIQFVFSNVRYAYGFSIQEHKISTEYLYYFPKNRPIKIFERDGMSIKPGDKYKYKFATSINTILRENKLFLPCAANFSKVKEVKDAFTFFGGNMKIFDKSDMAFLESTNPMNLEFAARLLHDEKKLKEAVLKLLQGLGTNVKEIKTKESESSQLENFDYLSPEERTPDRLERIDKPKVSAKIVYDKFEVDITEESRGVKRLFQLLPWVLIVSMAGGVLIFDEMEASLHESVLSAIVDFFQSPAINLGDQLIFSTHNTNLLNSGLFRRDQIWFTELDEERATDLYSLVEIKNVRKSENLAKGYISGKYGGIPVCNEKVAQEIES